MRMRKVSGQAGFSVIEVLLAATVFGVIATAVVGALVYGRQSTANSGDRSRAMALADEGIQAVRNIRNAAYSNLSAGTFGLAQSGGVWTLSGSSDTNGIYTRQTTISSGGTNRFTVTSTVSWTQATGNVSQVSDTTEFTNWAATTKTPLWSTPVLNGGINNPGRKVVTQGTYAYIAKNTTSNNFTIVNTATPATPTTISTISVSGTPTNIDVSGNYAYISTNNTAGELVIVNISNPAAPTVAGTYNASGTASGLGVYVSDGYVYLSRAANGGNDELVILNVSNPAVPTRVYGFSSNLAMNEVYVNNSNIFIATNNGSKEVIALTPVVFGSLYTEVDLNLPGTTAATTITGVGSAVYAGQGTSMHVINGALATPSLGILGSITLPGAINDLDANPSGTYVYAGTSSTTAEFQVVNINTYTTSGSINLSGTTSTITGVSYNPNQNIVVGVGVSTTQGTAVFGPT